MEKTKAARSCAEKRMRSDQIATVLIQLLSLVANSQGSDFPADACRRHVSQVLSIRAGNGVLLTVSQPEQVLAGGQSPDFIHLGCIHQHRPMNPYETATAELLFHGGDGFTQ